MRSVSTNFTNAVKAAVKSPQPMCLISWKKNISPAVKMFTLDQSKLDGVDKLKGAGGTVTFFDKYDYVNETPYVKNFRVSKKISSRPWGVIMSTAEIELNNTTKRFLPGMAADIGDNSDRPDRPVKLGIGFNGEYIKLFTGYTDRPEHEIVKRITKITAYDALKYLTKVKSKLPAFVNMYAHDIISALLIEQGFGPTHFSLEPSLQQPIGYLMPHDRFVTDILQEICESEGYLIHADEDGIIIGWNRLHFYGNASALWNFNYNNISDISWSSAPIINSASVVSKPLKPAPYSKIWEADSSAADRKVKAGQSLDVFAEFRDEIGNFPAISVDPPVNVSSGTTGSLFATNEAADGSGAVGSGVVVSSTYNFGDKYRMTFTNSGTVDLYITRITLWGQPAKVTAIKSDIQEIQSSIDMYGVNPDNDGKVYEIDNPLIQDAVSANTMARMLVLNNNQPRSKLDIDGFCVPHLQLGDSVNVAILDTGETKLCSVYGNELFLGVGANLTQKLYLEQRAKSTYFRLDQSNLDGSDKLTI